MSIPLELCDKRADMIEVDLTLTDAGLELGELLLCSIFGHPY